MSRLYEIMDVWEFANYTMPEQEQTANFAKNFRLRFQDLCHVAGISPVPVKSNDWDRLDRYAELPEKAKPKLEEVQRWLEKQSPTYRRMSPLRV